MRAVRLSFRDNPASFTAAYIAREGIDLLRTMIVSPTQRFKTYFAASLLQVREQGSALSPVLTTSSDLITGIVSQTGMGLASDMEKLTLLYNACEQTDEIVELFPENFLRSFRSYIRVSRKLLGSFEELSKEERDLEAYLQGATRGEGVGWAQLNLLRALGRNYSRLQHDRNCHDMNFLLGRVTEDRIRNYFAPYDTVILVSPLSLTRFEQRVYRTIDEKLTVIYQDTDEYDFSRILTFRRNGGAIGAQEEPPGGVPVVLPSSGGGARFFQVSSPLEQVMAALSLVREELAHGTEPQEIAVINSDDLFGRMLHDALDSLGIEANLSGGLPVKTSPLYQFLLLVSRFFNTGFDTEHFLELLRNEFFQELLGEKSDSAYREEYRRIRESIIRNRVFKLQSIRSSYIEGDERRRDIFGLLGRIHASKNFTALCTGLETLFSRLGSRKTYAYHAVREIIFDSARSLCDLSVGVEDSPLDVLLQTLGSSMYPLRGVYSRGVQILGLLEMRGITFRKVIVPFFNEGFYPLKHENDILLPLEVRDELGLASFLDREELSFYYLKRIVDAAEDAFLISIADKSGDIDVTSRYASHFGMTMGNRERSLHYTLPVKSTGSGGDSTRYDEAVLPTPAKDYSRFDVDLLKACETKYFIARVLGLEEPDELTRDVSPVLVGQRVHRVFAELYRDVDYAHLDRNGLSERLNALIDEHFPEGLFYSREEDLLHSILRENLGRALQHDLRRFEQGYRVCPEYMERDLEALLAGGRYRIRGRIDRVDRSPHGGFVLIDYKTGRLPARTPHLEEGDFREVQLGLYGILLQQNEPGACTEELCYFDLIEKHRLVTIVEHEDVEEYLSRFEAHLVEFLDRFNASGTLSLTDDLNTCSRCGFYNICRVYEV